MWIMLNDAFFSIVEKDCPADHLLVRARRPGDIQKVFGRTVEVKRETETDYLFRAVIPFTEIGRVMIHELRRIDYPNFKDSVSDSALHDAYLRVWTAMASLQNPPPYSGKNRFLQSLVDQRHPAIPKQLKFGGNVYVAKRSKPRKKGKKR